MSILQTVFQAYGEHRRKHPKMSEYEHLNQTPFLYSSGYVNDLYQRSSNRKQQETLYSYIERFEVQGEEYRGYHSIYEQLGKDLGYIEDEEYVMIPKSIIMEYLKGELQDDHNTGDSRGVFKHRLR